MSKARVKVRDENRIPQVVKALEELNSKSVVAGVKGSAKTEMIAHVNEYGCDIRVTDKMRRYLHANGLHLRKSTQYIKIPERSFIRSGYDENLERIGQAAEDSLWEMMSLNEGQDEALERVGEEMSDAIRGKLNDVNGPPLHPFTVKRKGSSDPLKDTGSLYDSVGYEVI